MRQTYLDMATKMAEPVSESLQATYRHSRQLLRSNSPYWPSLTDLDRSILWRYWSPLPDLNRGHPDVCWETCFFQLQSGALPTELSEANPPKRHHYLILISEITALCWKKTRKKLPKKAVLSLTFRRVDEHRKLRRFEEMFLLAKSHVSMVELWSRLSMVRVASPTGMGEHGE